MTLSFPRTAAIGRDQRLLEIESGRDVSTHREHRERRCARVRFRGARAVTLWDESQSAFDRWLRRKYSAHFTAPPPETNSFI